MFSGRGTNCQKNVTDLAGSLVMSSRPPGRPHKRPNDRTWNAGVTVRTADGSRWTADAGDEQCVDAAVRHVLWCFVLQTSMNRCTQLVLHPLRNVQPVQLVMQEMEKHRACNTAAVLHAKPAGLVYSHMCWRVGTAVTALAAAFLRHALHHAPTLHL